MGSMPNYFMLVGSWYTTVCIFHWNVDCIMGLGYGLALWNVKAKFSQSSKRTLTQELFISK